MAKMVASYLEREQFEAIVADNTIDPVLCL